jgi:glycosyltransferase involved in cell wall biosynthesis
VVTKLYIVPIEPLTERYSESWYRNLPITFSQAGYQVAVIDGAPLVHDDIKVGAFLDINSTAHYKATQLQKIAKMFHQGEVEQGSIFFFSDIEFWGLEQVRLLADMNGIKVFLTGFLHAASYTKDDAFAIAAPYQKYTEVGWIAALDQVYVGSLYHKQAVIDRRIEPLTMDDSERLSLADKIIVTKNPMFPWDYQLMGAKKEKLMLLTNRFDAEKNPQNTCTLFYRLKQIRPDWKFVVTTGRKTFRSNLHPKVIETIEGYQEQGILDIKVGLTKTEYHNYLERAAIVVSHSREENYGICVAESLICGCMPLLWNGASHPEHVANSPYFLFDDDRPNAVGDDSDYVKAQALMDRFEQDKAIVPSFDWSGMENIIKAMSTLK